MSRFQIFLLLLIPAIVFSTELVINGDFEQPLDNGWKTNAGCSIGNYDTTDTDMEARVNLYVDGWDDCNYLKQKIDITGYSPEFITFSCNALLKSDNFDYSLYCGAAVIVSYQDKYGNRIADTKIVYIDTADEYSQDTCWPNDTLQNASFIQNTTWNDYSFNIGDELVSIGLSNTDTIQYIEISILDTVFHKKDNYKGSCGST